MRNQSDTVLSQAVIKMRFQFPIQLSLIGNINKLHANCHNGQNMMMHLISVKAET